MKKNIVEKMLLNSEIWYIRLEDSSLLEKDFKIFGCFQPIINLFVVFDVCHGLDKVRYGNWELGRLG